MWRAASSGRHAQRIASDSLSNRAGRSGISPSQLVRAHPQLTLTRTAVTDARTADRPLPIFRYLLTFILGSGLAYTGAAYYALNDASFRKYWIENVPGGEEALKQVALASSKLRQTSIADIQSTASSTATEVTKKVEEAKTAVRKQYESALQTAEEVKLAATKTYSSAAKTVDETKQTLEQKIHNIQAFVGDIKDGALKTYDQTQSKIKETEQNLRGFATKVQHTYEDTIDSVEEKYEYVKSTITGEPLPPRKIRTRAAVEVSGPEAAAIAVTARNIAKDVERDALAAKAERTAENVKAEAKGVARQAAAKTEQVADAVVDKAKELGHKAERVAKKVEDKAKEVGHKLEDKAKEVGHDAERGTKKAELKAKELGHEAESKGKELAHKAEHALEKTEDKAKLVAHDAAVKADLAAKEVKLEAAKAEHAAAGALAKAKGAVADAVTKAEVLAHDAAVKVDKKLHEGVDKAKELTADAKAALVKTEAKVEGEAKAASAKAVAEVEGAAHAVKAGVSAGVEKVKEVAGKAGAKGKEVSETATHRVEALEGKAGAIAGAVGASVAAGVEKVKDSVKKVVEEVKDEVAIAEDRMKHKNIESGILETPETVMITTGETDSLILPKVAKEAGEKTHSAAIDAVKILEVDVESLISKLPDRPLSKDLAKSIGTLASTLNDLRAASHGHGAAAFDKAANELNVIVGYLNTLEKEEADLIRHSLDSQATKFADTLKSHVESTEKALEEQAKSLTSRTDTLLSEERQKLLDVHNEQLALRLSEQAAEFRSTLDADLRRQAEELERHWSREVKSQVDKERQGRLARLDHLSLKLKFLEKISIEGGEVLDRSWRVHRLWSALKAVQDKVGGGVREPFGRELGVLETAGETFPLVQTVIATIPPEAATEGIPTLPDLEKRFHSLSSVIRSTQLMPENGGGPVSYAVSNVLSLFVFRKRGMVPGDDVESVLSRAEWYLGEGDLEGAARE
ncbi:Formation of crista junctions protein 1, partial [Rhizophlyctis rosea]